MVHNNVRVLPTNVIVTKKVSFDKRLRKLVAWIWLYAKMTDSQLMNGRKWEWNEEEVERKECGGSGRRFRLGGGGQRWRRGTWGRGGRWRGRDGVVEQQRYMQCGLVVRSVVPFCSGACLCLVRFFVCLSSLCFLTSSLLSLSVCLFIVIVPRALCIHVFVCFLLAF